MSKQLLYYIITMYVPMTYVCCLETSGLTPEYKSVVSPTRQVQVKVQVIINTYKAHQADQQLLYYCKQN